MSKLTSLVRVPDRYLLVRFLATALLLGAVCWYLGADVWRAAMLGGAITLVGWSVLIGVSPEVRDIDWRGEEERVARGSRSDISTLSFRLRGTWGRVDHSVQWRARNIARRRLAFYGLDPQAPEHRSQIEEMIGADSYDFLVREQRGAPSMRALLRCLDTLDAIDPTHYASTPPPPPPTRARFRLPLRPRRPLDR